MDDLPTPEITNNNNSNNNEDLPIASTPIDINPQPLLHISEEELRAESIHALQITNNSNERSDYNRVLNRTFSIDKNLFIPSISPRSRPTQNQPKQFIGTLRGSYNNNNNNNNHNNLNDDNNNNNTPTKSTTTTTTTTPTDDPNEEDTASTRNERRTILSASNESYSVHGNNNNTITADIVADKVADNQVSNFFLS